MTVWDAIRALNRRGLSLKHKGRSEGYDRCFWLIGRRYGPLFAVIDALPSLVALEEWLEAR